MISYVPEDTFHVKEKKKGFTRKSKGKIKYCKSLNSSDLPRSVYVAGCLC